MSKSKKDKKKSGLIMIGGGLVFFLAGLAFLLVSLSSIWTGYQSKSWPSVEGQILTRELRTTSKSALQYLPHIEYRYEVEGKAYESSRIRFGGFDTERGEGEGVLEKFASDAVMVYYSQSDPSQAILEPGPQWGSNVLFLMGAFILMAFACVPFGLAYFELR